MKETIKKSNIRCLPVTFFLVTALIIATTAGVVAQAPAEKGVRFEMVNDQNKVDIFINGSLFPRTAIRPTLKNLSSILLSHRTVQC